MLFLRNFIGQELQWKRPRFFSSTYELLAGDQILATINFFGLLNRRTVAEAEGQQWTFQRTGFSGNKFLITPGESQTSNESTQPLIWVQPGWRKNGELTFPTGDTYTWFQTGNGRSSWSWIDGSGTTLLTLKKNLLLELAPAASETPHLALLTLFAFYLIQAKQEDDTTAVVSTIVG